MQRYLSGQSMQQARQGLWMNGVLKIPMQFFILLTGVLVFVFYLFHPSPLHWNEANLATARAPGHDVAHAASWSASTPTRRCRARAGWPSGASRAWRARRRQPRRATSLAS